MALSILDGNQSATTLSTILSSGQHITAHTVVSLGTQAITDMRGAVSGSVVSISNFPNSQTIAGTVTANAGGDFANSIENVNDVSNVSKKIAVQLYDDNGDAVGVSNNPLPIAGTVTANAFGKSVIGSTNFPIPIIGYDEDITAADLQITVPVQISSLNGSVGSSNPLPISGTVTSNLGSALPTGTNRIGVVTIGAGTVTLGASTAQIGSVTASISNSVTIGSLPAISGTVTANLSISSSAITSGSFTSLTSATLVPANTSRKMATVYNLGAGQLFVNAGATATTLGGGFMVVLNSGDFYECDYTTTTLSAIYATAGTASWMSH